LICSFNFLIYLAVCLNISTLINIKILTNSNQQTQSYKFTSHISAFLSVALITEMLEICIQTPYDQNVQLILKSYLPVVYGTLLIVHLKCFHPSCNKATFSLQNRWPYLRGRPLYQDNIKNVCFPNYGNLNTLNLIREIQQKKDCFLV
jgi:hypothetical protein